MPISDLDPLRTLLEPLDVQDRTQVLAFFRAFHVAGPEALETLGPNLLRPSAPRALRQMASEAAYYHPGPAWTPILARMLRHETDFGTFRTGTEALGRIRSPKALEALRELAILRAAPQFQSQVAEVLARADPAAAFRFHLGRLMEGSGNPGAANEAAHRLASLVDGASLAPLQSALRHPDLLIFRHALRLIAMIPTSESAAFLAGFLEETHRAALEDRTFKGALASFRGLQGSALREAVQGALDGLPDDAEGGSFRLFLVEMQALLQEGKAARIAARLAEAGEEIHLRARRLGYAVDAAAEGLAGLAHQGCIPPDEVIPRLERALREQTGREGVARALARLVPAGDGDRLDLLLAHPDAALRIAAIEALGARCEEALRPALRRACRDAIHDHAQRALFHLGQLADPVAQAQELLDHPQPAERELGLRFITLHGLADLAPRLLDEAGHAEREEWRIQVVGALGALGATEVAPALAELLHSGQSPRLQVALAEALRDMADTRAATLLAARAAELKQPLLHAVAVEALARAHAAPAPALPPEAFESLRDQVLGAWDDRNPWPLRLRVVAALEGLRLETPTQWSILAGPVHEAVHGKRPPNAWSPIDLARVQNALREWVRLAAN
jgi:HEAT repeat protein